MPRSKSGLAAVTAPLNWDDYRRRFVMAAEAAGKTHRYIEGWLAYACTLAEESLPIIYDEAHLAELVGYRLEYVLGAMYSPQSFYRTFSIPKRNGGMRIISEPLPSLKEIQRWILEAVLYRVPVSTRAKAFVPSRSIKDNARFHQRQPLVVSVDVRDFFPSVSRRRVFGVFRDLGYNRIVSDALARLCTLRDALPQGAPTSPAITNVVCRTLDKRLAGFASKHDIRYTRYADDIAISGDLQPGFVITFLRRTLKEEGFELHPEKIRVLGRHQRQLVTGVVVNEKMQAPRDVRRDLRQALYYIKRYGLDSHLMQTGETRRGYVRHLLGLANFILFLRADDKDALEAVELLRPLLRPGVSEL